MHRLLAAAIAVGFICAPVHAREVLFASQPGLGARAWLDTRSVDARQPQSPLRLRLRVGGVRLERKQEGFHSVKVEGLSPLGRVGAPDLAGTGALIALPAGLTAELRLIDQRQHFIESAAIEPCQEDSRCFISRNRFQFDSRLYKSQGLFPGSPAALEEVGSLQGVKILRVSFYPLRMDMRRRGLTVSTDLSVEVTFKGTARPVTLPASVAGLIRKNTVNGEQTTQLIVPAAGQETLVVVVADSLESALAPWVAWKRQRGLNVEVFRVSEAGNSANEIALFLKEHYRRATRKPSYLLLVGNATTAPGFLVPTSRGNAPSDYPYALMDGVDAIPDVFYGRLLANDAAELLTQTERWMTYEKNLAPQTFPAKATLIASDEGFLPSDEDYARQIDAILGSSGFTQIDLILERTSRGMREDIIPRVNDGRSWMTYFGHGTGGDWLWQSTFDSFGVGEIDRLENSHALPFLVDISCDNADWINLARPMGKAWVTQQNNGKPGGAIAYYGGSVKISWHEPATMGVGIAKYHFGRAARSVGAAIFAGQMYLLEQMGIAPNTLDNLKWFNLFGDPSLWLRTDAPRAYSVSHTKSASTTGLVLTIQARDAFSSGLEGVTTVVTAPSLPGALTAVTDKNGTSAVLLPGNTLPADALLTTSGYGLSTYQIAIH